VWLEARTTLIKLPGKICQEGTTRFLSVPIPSITISTVSPALRGPMPSGVPVAMTSPGSKVMMPEIKLINLGLPKIRSHVLPDCFISPFTRVSSFKLKGEIPALMQGPVGAKLS
jgi:hypothetical protein